jgi:hypothetical protein
MQLDETQRKILIYCSDDDMGLWVIVRYVTDPEFKYEKIIPEIGRKQVIRIIQEFMEEGLIEAGNPNGAEFTPIAGTVDDVIKFIEHEWEKLGKRPSGGDICWFRATPKGERLAHELVLDED